MNPNSETFQTSKEAYDWCVENNVLSARVADVLRALTLGGPMNQTMVHQWLIKETGRVGMEKYSISPRFAVLERMKLIRQLGKQACPVTGRTTVFYITTDRKPACTEQEALKTADKKETLKKLQEEVKTLREENRQLRELLEIRSASHAEKQKRIAERPPIAVQEEMFPS